MINEETQELNPSGRVELKNIIDIYKSAFQKKNLDQNENDNENKIIEVNVKELFVNCALALYKDLPKYDKENELLGDNEGDNKFKLNDGIKEGIKVEENEPRSPSRTL